MLIFQFASIEMRPRASPRFDAVADGVLDQRLKKGWNQGFLSSSGTLCSLKPFAKTLCSMLRYPQ
jgi:hypothetical protein